MFLKPYQNPCKGCLTVISKKDTLQAWTLESQRFVESSMAEANMMLNSYQSYLEVIDSYPSSIPSSFLDLVCCAATISFACETRVPKREAAQRNRTIQYTWKQNVFSDGEGK
jgi:hypothetical protein